MKNIHVLPTDKPSRLFENTDGGLSIDDELQPNGVMCQNHNIYITSDEEIKEGDWFHLDMSHSSTLQDEIHQMGSDGWSKTGGIHFCEGNSWIQSCKKIILTTDQDLIKDGVQAIDDEFLQWFVKNPSCEEVETEIVEYGFDEVPICIYEIIIPKEEAKPFKDMLPLTKVQWKKFKKNPIPSKKEEHYERTTQSISLSEVDKEESCNCTDECLGYLTKNCKGIKEEPKQETLEEVAERIAHNFEEPSFKAGVVYGIIEGAKWQQERMYSEEEVEDLIYKVCGTVARLQGITLNGNHIDTAYKQFKKK